MRRGTYSIVARDPDTGELGVAVQSHWFSVGSIVSWALPGVGAVATQSIAEPAYGPRLLDRLREGESPSNALQALLAADEQARFRQVAVVDARGGVAVHTGDGCIPHAGDVEGDGFSVQANMMASAGGVAGDGRGVRRRRRPAGAAGCWRRSRPPRRRAATCAGASPRRCWWCRPTGEVWQKVADLRVEDDPEPLVELRRLLDLCDAYAVATEGDDLVGEGRHAEAAERYRRGVRAGPGQRRAAVLGRPRGRPGRRRRRGRAATCAARSSCTRLAGAAGAPRSRDRAGAEPVREALGVRASEG